MDARSSGLFAIILVTFASGISAQQVADLEYRPSLARPAYEAEEGPRVGVDEAHQNFHTVNGRYGSFAELLRRDGYRVEGFRTQFSAESLAGVDVLVIANALHERNANDWSLPTPSAFTQDEIAALRAWVESGGSLFLIADHMPFPGAAADLAAAFGIRFSNGYAIPGHRQPRRPDTFNRDTGLEVSAVTHGRSEDEAVTSVATFGGSAFEAPESATPVLVFGPGSVSRETERAGEITPGTPTARVEGWYQGALLTVGDGRVSVFGEAAMFSAQRAGPERRPIGMNAPEAAQNHQLLLNVMHWLTRAAGMS